jgi:hypothetical protein
MLMLSMVCASLVTAVTVETIAVPQSAQAVDSYNNAAIADAALAKVGTSNRQQCRPFVNDIVWSLSGHTQSLYTGGGSDYFSQFEAAGGVRITDFNALVMGDIVQKYVSSGDLHTWIIVSRDGDGLYWVVDSNSKPDTMYEQARYYKRTSFTGLSGTVRAYRMGTVTPSVPTGSGAPITFPQGSGVGNATFLGGDTIVSGEFIYPNQYILSEDGRYAAILQNDGNFVVYGPNYNWVWQLYSAGQSITRLTLQQDGNLVLFNSSSQAYWHSHTWWAGPSSLTIQNDGNLVLSNANGVTWSSGYHNSTGAGTYLGEHRLFANQVMYPGQYLRSPDKRYIFILQGDGNLVLYGPGYHALWQSGTGGKSVSTVIMQGDGNLVIYGTGSQGSLWQSGNGQGSSTLTVQSDGNIVVYGPSTATWITNTHGQL